jgi:hypothetical protein
MRKSSPGLVGLNFCGVDEGSRSTAGAVKVETVAARCCCTASGTNCLQTQRVDVAEPCSGVARVQHRVMTLADPRPVAVLAWGTEGLSAAPSGTGRGCVGEAKRHRRLQHTGLLVGVPGRLDVYSVGGNARLTGRARREVRDVQVRPVKAGLGDACGLSVLNTDSHPPCLAR